MRRWLLLGWLASDWLWKQSQVMIQVVWAPRCGVLEYHRIFRAWLRLFLCR